MIPSAKPILVTGSHRSGTTWTGRMLAAAPRIAYIHEPFNASHQGIHPTVNPKPFEYWFQYLCEENSQGYDVVFDGILKHRYFPGVNLTNLRTARKVAKSITLRRLMSTLAIKSATRLLHAQGRFLLHKINRHRPLIKDPIAVFSAEWLSRRYDMNVLVMLRHPAAFCSSLKIRNWTFDFNHFLNQPLLMEKYLGCFTDDIHEHARTEKDIIDQGALLWNCIHHTIRIYRDSHPDWLFVKHEDLSADPVNQFKSIYRQFGLEFTSQAKHEILRSSGAHNPVEQQTGNEFSRNSKENIFNWKTRLTPDEIARIRLKTAEIAPHFYDDSSWQRKGFPSISLP